MSPHSVNGHSGDNLNLTPAGRPPRRRGGGRTGTRLMAALVAIGLVGLLVTARCLTPNSDGVGTHRQLGLPPCSMLWMTGVRCPGCGMTTSWAHATRGQFLAAARTNPAGLMLAVLSAVVAAAAVRVALTGARVTNRQQWHLSYVMLFIGAVAMIDWTRRLIAGGVWPF